MVVFSLSDQFLSWVTRWGGKKKKKEEEEKKKKKLRRFALSYPATRR